MTIVMSAVIPARRSFGAPVKVTVTGYETTLPEPLLSPAVGAIAETVPAIVAPMASMPIVASWPTDIELMSLSTTSAVTS